MTISNFLTANSSSIDMAGVGLSALGQFTRGQGYMEHGMTSAAAAQFAAQQMRANANAAAGSAERQGEDIGLRTQYIASRALSMAAGGGGGASDPTVINTIARIQGEGAYRQASAIYSGQERARQMDIAASGEVWSGNEELRVGRQAANASDIAATSTVLKGATSLFERFGRNGPAPGDPGSDIF